VIVEANAQLTIAGFDDQPHTTYFDVLWIDHCNTITAATSKPTDCKQQQ